jgi:hypothetical protein
MPRPKYKLKVSIDRELYILAIRKALELPGHTRTIAEIIEIGLQEFINKEE